MDQHVHFYTIFELEINEQLLQFDGYFSTLEYAINYAYTGEDECSGLIIEVQNGLSYEIIQDCACIFGGDAELDECGICEGDSSECPEYLLGDINADGLLNILDLVIIANTILDNDYNEVGDLNSDDALNILDLVLLVNVILFS